MVVSGRFGSRSEGAVAASVRGVSSEISNFVPLSDAENSLLRHVFTRSLSSVLVVGFRGHSLGVAYERVVGVEALDCAVATVLSGAARSHTPPATVGRHPVPRR